MRIRIVAVALLSVFLVQTSLYAGWENGRCQEAESIWLVSPLRETLDTEPVDAMKAGLYRVLKWQFVVAPIAAASKVISLITILTAVTTAGATPAAETGQPDGGNTGAVPVAQTAKRFKLLWFIVIDPLLEELEYNGYYLSVFNVVSWLEAKALKLVGDKESSKAVMEFIRQGHKLTLAAWFGISHQTKLRDVSDWSRFLIPAGASYFVLQPLAEEKGLIASLTAHVCWNAALLYSTRLLTHAYFYLWVSVLQVKL